MRKKSLTLLGCVYAALCISYTAASSAMMPKSDEGLLYAEADSAPAAVQSIRTEENAGTAKPDSGSSAPDTKTQETQDSPAVSEETFPESRFAEAIVSTEESKEEQLSDEDEYQEEKPSLSEYLRGLRCSGCRHNCSLLSPRCMNGSRKASQAESAYYEIYGT